MQRSVYVLFCVFAALCGCNPTSTSNDDSFGHFDGEIVASWAENGRDMILKDTFRYIDSNNRQWECARWFSRQRGIDSGCILVIDWGAIRGQVSQRIGRS